MSSAQAAAWASRETQARELSAAFKLEAQRCVFARVCQEMSDAFDSFPEAASFSVAPRGMGLGLVLCLADGRPVDEDSLEFDDDLSELDAEESDDPSGGTRARVRNAFHLFESLTLELCENSERLPWNIHHDDWHGQPVPRGAPLDIASSLGIDWLLPWIESQALEASSGPPNAPSPTRNSL